MTRKKPDTLPLPDNWKDDFKSATMRTNFILTLTQPMIQFLSACADDCHWDRALFCSIHAPDNWPATAQALTKRGLIVHRANAKRELQEIIDTPPGEWTPWELTPAGKAVVSLLKVTGIFVEADAAINKKARRG